MMTKYVIKSYENGFEVEQERIGREVALNFLQPHQTPAERLKEVYSQEGFDPETRLYAFKDDKMVGFLTARVLDDQEDGVKRGSLTPPSVLSEHEEVTEILFNRAINVLIKKGVQKVQSTFGYAASKDAGTAKKWGYKEAQNKFFLYEIEFNKMDDSTPTDKVTDFDFDKHQETIAKVMAEEYERDFEWANAFYERIKTQTEPKRIQYVIEEDGKINAYAGLVLNNIKKSQAGLFVIRAENQEYMKIIMTKVAQTAKEENIERLTLAFTDENDIEKEKYKGIPFKLIGTAGAFEKEL